MYCIYDKRHDDYGYTQAWVNMLIEKFKDGKLYEQFYGTTEVAVPKLPEGQPGQ